MYSREAGLPRIRSLARGRRLFRELSEFLQIYARAECITGAGQEYNADRLVGFRALKGSGQFAHQCGGQRILGLGSVEGHDSQAIVHRVGHELITHLASPLWAINEFGSRG